jgi:thioredoxin-dependent peroxiredoxin
VLGASFDSVDKNRAFAEKYGYPFKLLSFDKSNDVMEAGDPSDPEYPRRISYLIGPDRHIVRAYDKVKPAAHPAQVLGDVP